MITIISPAKNMKVDRLGTKPLTLPCFVDEAQEIWGELKKFLPEDLQILMKINDKLADDSFDRIQHMKFDMEGTSAVETYDGIQYKYMNPQTFSEEGKAFAQAHLRVLSGLYGVVRPYDSIYEYRLEMLTKLPVGGCKNLYEFWGRKLYERLIGELDGTMACDVENDVKIWETCQKNASLLCGKNKEGRVILNLASDEYGKTIRKYLKAPYRMVTCHFKTYSKGKYKVLATAAKMARGSMVRYICENQIDDLEKIKEFDWEGYRFEESLSTLDEFVFLQV